MWIFRKPECDVFVKQQNLTSPFIEFIKKKKIDNEKWG